ncbi:MAG: polymer-forming cytoskeletal protein [Lachnospiraceae bacterium]|nr:polymer-forming cytoskeletal protein [Lachnospiraceae bacterium]
MGFFSDLKEDLNQAASEKAKPKQETPQEIDLDTTQKLEDLEETLQSIDVLPQMAQEQVSEEEVGETFEQQVLPFEFLDEEDEKEPLSITIEEREPELRAPRPKRQPKVREEEPEQITFTETAKEPVKPAAEEKEVPHRGWVLNLENMDEMDETAVITAGMRVKGDILSNGSADIFGEVYGNVQVMGRLNVTGKIEGNSKAAEIFADGAKIRGDVLSDGEVQVGIGTVIVGNVEGTEAVIAGAVKGNIDIKGPVIIDAAAVVLGDVKAKTIQINNGARIEGMCMLCYAEQSAAKFFEEQEA